MDRCASGVPAQFLQRELNVLAHSIIQIDLWHVDRGLIRAMFKYDRKNCFSHLTVSRRSGDHH